MRKVETLIKCDHCGGPAVWCVIDGYLCYHCQRQCSGFMQMELWDEEPKWEQGVANAVRVDDQADPDEGLPF